MVRVDLLCLGTGKASTHIYHGEPSTGFVVLQDGEPVLLLGAGLGSVRSCVHYCKRIPDTIYISHNHSDHAGELPLLLSVEAGKGRRKRVVAEPHVMTRLLNHRLAEYHESITLSNRKLSDLAEFIECPEQEISQVTSHLSIIPYRSQHSERCFGFTLFYLDKQILGWSADSGYDPQYYAQLATAPVLVLDARQTGSFDHAGFENVIEYEADLAAAADAQGTPRVAVYVTAYGTQAEMPTVPQALRIGQTLVLCDDLEIAPQASSVEYEAHAPVEAVSQRSMAVPSGGYQSRAPTSEARARSGGYPASAASPGPTQRHRGGHGQSLQEQRSADIQGYLSKVSAGDVSHATYDRRPQADLDEKSYLFPLPGQKSAAPYAIKKFPSPAPGPKKIYVYNNECKGAPSRMFLIKNVRTLDQLKLKVADSLNIKPIKHLYRLDGVPIRSLDDVEHLSEVVATKHAGAPFDPHDLPLHIRAGGHDY